jgi:hypothetical protein
MSKPIAWSYSALNAFETCCWRYYLTKVTKEVTEAPTEATMWGNRVHKALEHRLGGKPLADTMVQFEPFAKAVLSKGGRVDTEQKVAVNAAFQPVGYFAPDVWCRAVTDFTVHKGEKLFVGDWKTGKPTPESAQLRLSAAMSFAHRPYIKECTVAFVWLKGSTPPTVEKFTRDEAPSLWAEFLPRVKRLQDAVDSKTFPKRPSGLCKKHCPVPKEKCEFRGEG